MHPRLIVVLVGAALAATSVGAQAPARPDTRP